MMIWQNEIKYDKIQFEIWHSPMTCRDHPTAAEAWTESRTDATAAEPVFFVWLFREHFPTKIFASFSWYKEIFFPRKYWPNALCFFTRICLHWVPVFKKIFSKKTFPSYSLFSENISKENILTLLPFSEIIFPRNYYPPPPRLLPPPPLLLLLRPLLPCWFLIISLTCINFLIRISTSNKIFFDKSR